MKRELNPVFLRARDAIEPLLERHGFRLTEDLFSPAAFGSARAEYRHRARWLSLTWDGKDASLSLSAAVSSDQHAGPGRNAWHSLDDGNAVIVLSDGVGADARIEQLIGQVESFLEGKSKQ